jgi:glycosyltransferase involved in cell wall biosynthesis
MSSDHTSVLMLIDNLHEGAGGGERFVVGLATELARRPFEVTVCTTRQARGAVLDALLHGGVRHFGLERRTRRDIVRFRRLAGELRTKPPDVLHAHKFGSNVWGTLFGRAFRVPAVVAHEQTWSYEGNPVRKVIDGRLIGRLASAFVAVSTADAERMVALEGVPADKVAMIPNAYIPSWRSARAGWSLRGELGLADDAQLIGTAAMLRPQKAQHVLVDAFARLAPGQDDVHLVIAGEGECRRALEAQIGRLGLVDRVHLLGHRDDTDAIVSQLDVAALSSDYEGTPLFAFECFAQGTPLVATQVGGLVDIVDDGVNGRLVPRRNAAAMAEALEALLRSPEQRRALAGAAERQLESFRMPRIADRFAALYERLLADARRAGR